MHSGNWKYRLPFAPVITRDNEGRGMNVRKLYHLPLKAIVAWIDNSTRSYDADKAVRLCAVPRIAACIMGAEAPDKALADMLNRLLDEE